MGIKLAVVTVTPLQQNCSILWCEETLQAAIIDPGGDAHLIEQAVDQVGVSVEKILLTHGHIDHAAAATQISQRYKVDIEGPEKADESFLKNLPEQGKKWGIPALPVNPNRWLSHGDKVNVGNLELDVKHCPGHTPGHVVFLYHPQKIAVVGDVIFQGSIGRTDLPLGDHDQLLMSIRDQILTLDDDWGFLPGHGPTSTIGQERNSNPFLQGL
ncbi:MAG: MBL fold metallo-hydrolase [Rhodospirillales bacterium]|jgi:hydroxyacylglutathione hydrolase